MTEQRLACPKCTGWVGDPVWWSSGTGVPGHGLFVCNCGEVIHLLRDGSIQLLGDLLAKDALGDDRVRAAISKPVISTVHSFVDVFENVVRSFRMDLAEASGELRSLMAQIENRIDFAISVFAGTDMVWDRANEALAALRTALELVSTMPARNRAARKEGSDDPGPSRPTE